MPAAACDASRPGSPRSNTKTDNRRLLSSRAIARPITPAPTTITSQVFTCSLYGLGHEYLAGSREPVFAMPGAEVTDGTLTLPCLCSTITSTLLKKFAEVGSCLKKARQ